MLKNFELCPNDTGAVVLEIIDNVSLVKSWREAKKYFGNIGYKGKFMIIENYDANGNTIVHHVNIK